MSAKHVAVGIIAVAVIVGTFVVTGNREQMAASMNNAIKDFTSTDIFPDGILNQQSLNAGGCMGTARCLEGTVSKIVDGDTLDMGKLRIRLALVNTPELGDAGYTEGKELLAQTCPVGGSILFDEDDGQLEGSYDRAIGKVYCQGSSVSANEILVAQNRAEIVKTYCNESEFRNESWTTC